MLGVEGDSFQRDCSPHTAPAIVGFAVGRGLGAGSEPCQARALAMPSGLALIAFAIGLATKFEEPA
jgi:hypothetical protein